MRLSMDLEAVSIKQAHGLEFEILRYFFFCISKNKRRIVVICFF